MDNLPKVLNLGKKVEIVRARMAQTDFKNESKAILESYGPLIAEGAMEEIITKMSSQDPEERKEAREWAKIFAPKMYESKNVDTNKGEEKVVVTEEAKAFFDKLIANQDKIVKFVESKEVTSE